MDKEMMRALEADGEKLRDLTGEDHGPMFVADDLVTRLRHAHEHEGVDVERLFGAAADRIEALMAEKHEQAVAILELQREACARDGVPMPSERPVVDKLRDRIEALQSALRHIATAPVEAGMYPSPAHWLRDIARRALEAK